MLKKKPKPAPQRDYTPWIFGGAVLIGALVWLYNWGVPNPRGDKPMVATLRLDNQCGLVEDAYIITTYPGNETATFSNGIARITTTTNSYIEVKASPKYPAFSLDAPRVKVEENMVVPVRCQPESRAKRTLETFNEQFKK